MTDPPRSAESNDDVAAYPGMPRWVKAFGVVAILVVMLVILRLTVFGGHGHGPGRHFRAPDAPGEPASSVEDPASSSNVADGHTPPHGGH